MLALLSGPCRGSPVPSDIPSVHESPAWEGAAALHLIPLDPLGRYLLPGFSFLAKVLLIKMFTKHVYAMTHGSELCQKLVC